MSIRTNNSVCRWHQSTALSGEAATARGSAFLDERFLADEALARRVAETAAAAPADRRLETMRELASKLDGFWAFAVEWPDGEMIAAVDRLRTIPLSYGRMPDNELVVANEIRDLSDCSATGEFDEEAMMEYLLSGYVIGARTLRPGIRQLQPGEILHWKNRELVLSRYYRFLRSGWSTAGRDIMMDQLSEIMDRVFARLVKQYHDRRVFVSLSGGLDSRLVLAMLKRHGHPDLTAFTYGFSTEENTVISREVAEAAGVPWEFVSYDEGDWQPLLGSSQTSDFLRYSGQDSTVPHIQDYLALHKYRRMHPRIDATFFTGMAGDMIAGAWVPEQFKDNEGPLDIEKVCQWMYYRKFAYWPTRGRVKLDIINRMKQYFAEAPFTEVHNSAAAFDLFELENRQSKFICNSTRTLDYHGIDWQMPLCAHDLMDFYLTVPTELRELKRLFALWMRERVFVGSLSRLGEIPPEGDGRFVWYNIPRHVRRSLVNCAWRHTRTLVKRKLLPRFAHWRIFSGIVREAYQPLRISEWFVSGEREAKTKTLGDLLDDREGRFAHLPPVAAEYVAKYRHYPACMIVPLGLLALACLSEINGSA